MTLRPATPRPASLQRATGPWEPSRLLRGTGRDVAETLRRAGSCVVLTGAGVSTDSGVPDYRGPDAPRGTPMLYEEFVSDADNRRRYWARAYRGWAGMGHARPNAGHRAIAAWEASGTPCHLAGLITQNVDSLHQEAGSRRLVALHGRISDVVCLTCGDVSSRAALQRELARLNPDAALGGPLGHAELRPDGDAVVEDWQRFVVPACGRCGGVLKPDVVFFGESVPGARVAQARAWCDEADALLVAGSSLTVMSGLRFVRQVAASGKPVIIVNRGATRGDELAAWRLDASASETLEALVGAGTETAV